MQKVPFTVHHCVVNVYHLVATKWYTGNGAICWPPLMHGYLSLNLFIYCIFLDAFVSVADSGGIGEVHLLTGWIW